MPGITKTINQPGNWQKQTKKGETKMNIRKLLVRSQKRGPDVPITSIFNLEVLKMTVKEMIEKLKKCNPGATIVVDSAHANTGGANIQAVNDGGGAYVKLIVCAELRCY